MAEVLAGVYLGFDYGERNIGVAVGQTFSGTASPLFTVREATRDGRWRAIQGLVEQWKPAGLVVGVAWQQDGEANPVTSAMLRFCRQLEGRFHLPVHTMDETLSTAESKSIYRARTPSRTARRFVDMKDEMAACLILESWLAGRGLQSGG